VTNVKTYENCMDCPKHRVIRDDDPHDSFNDDDKAIVCTDVKNPEQDVNSEYLSQRSEYRIVMPAIRPYNLRKEGDSPSWCPLKAQAASPAA